MQESFNQSMSEPIIAIIHPNALCCAAIRSLITDFAPFEKLFGQFSVASYPSLSAYQADGNENVLHFFVAESVVRDNPDFFTDRRKCLVLCEGLPSDMTAWHCLNIACSEQELFRSFIMMHQSGHSLHNMVSAAPVRISKLLSEREQEVLKGMVKGKLNKEIADELCISQATVIFHRTNICAKLGTKSIGRMAIYAVLEGLVGVDEI